MGRREHDRLAARVQGAGSRRLLLRGQRRGHRHLHPGAAAVHRRHQRGHRALGRLRRGAAGFRRGRLPGAAVGDGPTRCGARWRARPTSSGPSFDDSVVPEPVDNAGGDRVGRVRHDRASRRGATDSSRSSCATRCPPPSSSAPTNAGSPKGVPINFTATATDTAGAPYAGRTLRWPIIGVNPAGGLGLARRERHRHDRRSRRQRGRRHGGRVRRLQQQRHARAGRAAGVGARHVHRQRGADVHGAGSPGDRPGGGGAGRPLVISVNCNEQSTVTVSDDADAAPARRVGGGGAAQAPAPDQAQAQDDRRAARPGAAGEDQGAAQGRAPLRRAPAARQCHGQGDRQRGQRGERHRQARDQAEEDQAQAPARLSRAGGGQAPG